MVKPQHSPALLPFPSALTICSMATMFCSYFYYSKMVLSSHQENMPAVVTVQNLDLGTLLDPALVFLKSNPEAMAFLGCLGEKTTAVSCLSAGSHPRTAHSHE